jgi:glycosyltransferase involved in cell wall biosynthesis
MNKKIAFFIGNLSGGGAEGVCVTLVNELAARGADIALVVINPTDNVRLPDVSDKVRLVNLGKAHVYTAVCAIQRYLKSAKLDVIISFTTLLSIIIGLTRYFLPFPLKLISRNIIFQSASEKARKRLGLRGNLLNAAIKKFYSRSDVFIAQCRAMGDDLITFLNLNPGKVVVIYNPVSPRIEEFVKEHDISALQKGNYLLCIGRLVAAKAFHYTIEAFAQIAAQYPGLHLKIVGEGSEEARLKQLVVTLGISDLVDFEGYQHEVIPYYTGAVMTLLTSSYEGFPNVLLESIALGTPVVAFDCPSGPGEIVQDGLNGYLVKPQDTDHLVECLQRALDRTWDARLVSATAEKFSSSRIVDEYERVLV